MYMGPVLTELLGADSPHWLIKLHATFGALWIHKLPSVPSLLESDHTAGHLGFQFNNFPKKQWADLLLWLILHILWFVLFYRAVCRKHELTQYELEMDAQDLTSKKQQREELATGVSVHLTTWHNSETGEIHITPLMSGMGDFPARFI